MRNASTRHHTPHSPVVISGVVLLRHHRWRMPKKAPGTVLRDDAGDPVEEVALDQTATELVRRGRDSRLRLADAEEDAEDHARGLVHDAEMGHDKRMED